MSANNGTRNLKVALLGLLVITQDQKADMKLKSSQASKRLNDSQKPQQQEGVPGPLNTYTFLFYIRKNTSQNGCANTISQDVKEFLAELVT